MKYKKGDVVHFGNTEIEITTKRGADAMNKHKPKTVKDFGKFSRRMKSKPMKKSNKRYSISNLAGF